MIKDNKQVILARERTHLANERTLLAYWRTALAFSGSGLLIIRFFPTKLFILVGELAVIFGIVLFINGTLCYYKNKNILNNK